MKPANARLPANLGIWVACLDWDKGEQVASGIHRPATNGHTDLMPRRKRLQLITFVHEYSQYASVFQVKRISINLSRGFRANRLRVLNRVTLATQVLSTTPATHLYYLPIFSTYKFFSILHFH